MTKTKKATGGKAKAAQPADAGLPLTGSDQTKSASPVAAPAETGGENKDDVITVSDADMETQTVIGTGDGTTAAEGQAAPEPEPEPEPEPAAGTDPAPAPPAAASGVGRFRVTEKGAGKKRGPAGTEFRRANSRTVADLADGLIERV